MKSLRLWGVSILLSEHVVRCECFPWDLPKLRLVTGVSVRWRAVWDVQSVQVTVTLWHWHTLTCCNPSVKFVTRPLKCRLNKGCWKTSFNVKRFYFDLKVSSYVELCRVSSSLMKRLSPAGEFLCQPSGTTCQVKMPLLYRQTNEMLENLWTSLNGFCLPGLYILHILAATRKNWEIWASQFKILRDLRFEMLQRA